MAKLLPKTLIVPKNKKIFIIEKPLPYGQLGYWDKSISTVYVAENQHQYSKWTTLFHEALHAIDDEIIKKKLKKLSFTERSIDFAANSLMSILVMNDLTDIITKEEVNKNVFSTVFHLSPNNTHYLDHINGKIRKKKDA